MRILSIASVWSLACLTCIGADVHPAESCEGMFGRPVEATGLDPTECSPRCDCENGSFEPPDYTQADLLDLEAWVLLDPPAELTANPYASRTARLSPPEAVCAIVVASVDAKTYRLRSFDSERAALDAGAWITHTGPCGVCSTLEDLAVYIRHEDLATPVRRCGLQHFLGSMESHLECLEELGFQKPCAQIWYYNTIHTRKSCLGECMSTLGASYHDADGALNACIRCDEDLSGPVFKTVAGRTRRNSGLPSALCRPCNTVSRIVHRYPPAVD